MRKKDKKKRQSVFPKIAGDYPVKRIVVDGEFDKATDLFGYIGSVERSLAVLRHSGSAATTVLKKEFPGGSTITSSIVGAQIINKIETKKVKEKKEECQNSFGFMLYAGNDVVGYHYQLLSDTFIAISDVLYSEKFEFILEAFPFCGQIEAYQRADYFFNRGVEEAYLAKDEVALTLEVPEAARDALLYTPPYCTLGPGAAVYDVAFFGAEEFEYVLPVTDENPPSLISTSSSSWKERRFSVSRSVVDPGSATHDGWAKATLFASIAECCEAKCCGDSAGLSFGLARLVRNAIIDTVHINEFEVVSTDILDCANSFFPREVSCDILDYTTGEITDRDPVDQNGLDIAEWDLYKLQCAWLDMYMAFSINTPAGVMKRKVWTPRVGPDVLPDDIDVDMLQVDAVEKYRSLFFDKEFQSEVFATSLAGKSSFGDYFVAHSGNYVDFVEGVDTTTATKGKNNDSIFVESKMFRLKFRNIIRPTLIARDRAVRSIAALYDKDVPDPLSEDASNRIVFTIIDNNMRAIELFVVTFRSVMFENGKMSGSMNNFYSSASVKNSDGAKDIVSTANLENSVFKFVDDVRLLQYRKGSLPKDSPEIVIGTLGINRCMTGGLAGPENYGKKLSDFLKETNRIREENGVGRVSFSHELSLAARMHATEAANTGIYAHIGKSGQNPIHRSSYAQYGKKSKYQYTVSENIAYGQKTAIESINAFMLSTAGHRENLLHYQWKDVGLAVIQSAPGVVLDGSIITDYLIWVQVFGLQQTE